MKIEQFLKEATKFKAKDKRTIYEISIYGLIDIIQAYSTLGEVPYMINQLVFDIEDGEVFTLYSVNDINLVHKLPGRFRQPTTAERESFKKTKQS